MHLWTIILAAGQGTRLGNLPDKKQFLIWKNRPLFWHSVQAFARVPVVQGIVLVFSPSECQAREEEVTRLASLDTIAPELRMAPGGSTRQASSLSGLNALPRECSHVLIHDAARPFISPELISRIIDQLATGKKAVVPGLPLTDTVKRLRAGSLETLPREDLFAVQTPQGFCVQTIAEAHRLARTQGLAVTDDAALVEILGKTVTLAEGDEANIKMTRPSDLERLGSQGRPRARAVAGWGYDVHRFGRGRAMKLGGVPITNGPQIVAHSDGDVLLHAIIDALLGCLGRGDIGELFPDTDPRLEEANSAVLLAEVLEAARKTGLSLDHLDATVICQKPRLGPWKDQIRSNLTGLLDMPPNRINIKATTEEGLGFTGAEEGIKAVALMTAHLDEPEAGSSSSLE